jgi:hypothetical protein
MRAGDTPLMAAVLWLLAAASVQGATPAETQTAFERGLQALAAGDLQTGVGILRGLAEETDAPRIRLELARALFLAEDYRASRREFLTVYRRDLPYPVRRNINQFLEDIDKRVGFLQPALGLSVDSNPTQAANSGVYQVFNAPLAYRSPAHRAVGVTYRIEALQPLVRRPAGQWEAVGQVQGLISGAPHANQASGQAGLRYDDFVRDSYATLGLRASRFGETETQATYLDYHRRLLRRRDRTLVLDAAVQWGGAAGRKDLAGETYHGALTYAQDISAVATGRIGLGATASALTNPLVPRATITGLVGVSRSFPRLKADALVSLSVTRAAFRGTDVFFGEQRADDTARLEVDIYRAKPVFSLFPGLNLSYEQRSSTIAFFRYRRAGVAMDFRRRF